MAITATGAEVGIFAGQGGGLDPVDRIGVGILRGDGSAALALADKRTLAAVSLPYSVSSSVADAKLTGLRSPERLKHAAWFPRSRG